MNQGVDVVIVGGGIIGCSIAYALRRRGVAVVIFDQGSIGAQASSAATGMLAPLKPFAKTDDPYTAWLLDSLAHFPSLVSELEEISGIGIDYQRTGTIRVMKEKQLSRLQMWITTWRQQGFPLELLVGDDIRRCEPGLASIASLALYNPHDPQLLASQFMSASARAAERLGAVFYPHEGVTLFSHSGTTATGVQTTKGRHITCNHLVLATGAWAGLHSEWLGFKLPVHPLRGSVLHFNNPLSRYDI